MRIPWRFGEAQLHQERAHGVTSVHRQQTLFDERLCFHVHYYILNVRLIHLILYRLSKVTIVQYIDFHKSAQNHLLWAGYSWWQKSRRAKAYLLSSSSSLFKRVKPADDDRTTKTATSRMDSFEHPVPVLRHLSVVTDRRSQVPPASTLQTSGSALLSDVGSALLFHLGHIGT